MIAKIKELLIEAENHFHAENFYKQIELYKEVLKLDIYNIEALINISDCYLKIKMHSEAKNHALNAYFLYGEVDDMATVNYSCILIDCKDYTQTIEILENEKSKGSNNYLVYNNLGYAYFLTEQYANALDNYTISISIEENNPLAYCNRGNLKYTIFNDKNGIEDLKKAQLYGDIEAAMILLNIANDKSFLS